MKFMTNYNSELKEVIKKTYIFLFLKRSSSATPFIPFALFK
jgi:hypothetical protein